MDKDFHFQFFTLRLEVQLEFAKLHTQIVVLQDVLQPFNMIYCFGELVVLQLIDIYMYILNTLELQKDQDEARNRFVFLISCLWF